MGNVIVDGELSGVDDAHVHAGLDRLVEKGCVHGFAHGVIAAEGEGEVAHAAADFGVGQRGLDDAGRFDEVDRIVIMLFHAGGDGENVGVKNNVFRRKADLLGQNFVGPAANLDLTGHGIGLPDFVKSHDDDGGAIAADARRLLDKALFALLQADGVDHGLALNALEPGLQNRPARRIDDNGHARDVRLGGNELEEARHGRFAVEHAVVKVDVDELRAILNLLRGDGGGLFVLLVLDQPLKLGRAGHVRALADVDEIGLLGQHQRLQSAEARAHRDLRHARGGRSATAAAMARMWSGVVPQQPPTIFRKPAWANSPNTCAM